MIYDLIRLTVISVSIYTYIVDKCQLEKRKYSINNIMLIKKVSTFHNNINFFFFNLNYFT